jgi:hypothetical protein
MKLLNKTIPLDTFLLVDELNDISLIDKLIKDIYSNTEFHHTYTNVVGKHTKFNFLSKPVGTHTTGLPVKLVMAD